MNFEELKIADRAQVALISVCVPALEGHQTLEESKASLSELRALLTTLGLSPGKEYIQNKKEMEAATVVGLGKLQEIAEEAKAQGVDLLAFDFELSASQARNIKEITKLNVVDRNYIILEIFAKHARTKEAKLQIEISKLQYMLPRLTAMWGHLGRQKGGIGVRGGEGEQQLELDRRLIRERIETLKRQLAEVVVSREEQRKKRKHKALTAALVGYTNAGKSSLMNRLCRVTVLEEDKLFATLDSTYRALNPDTKPPMILIDTVGFISNLPTSLISGFRSTLESAMEADLLVIVCDISDPQCEKHLKVTEDTLNELGLGSKDKVIVFNKKDQLPNIFAQKIMLKKHQGSFLVSANSVDDMNELRTFLINHFLNKQQHYDLFVPYEKGEIHSRVHGSTNVMADHPYESGIFYRVKIPDWMFFSLGLAPYLLAPGQELYAEWEELRKSQSENRV